MSIIINTKALLIKNIMTNYAVAFIIELIYSLLWLLFYNDFF